MNKFCILLLISSSLYSMEEKALPLSKETAYLVHHTRFFPNNGQMIAGTVTCLEDFGLNEQVPLSDLYKQADESLTAYKNTLHWSLNSLGNFREPVFRRYIIIEPLSAFPQMLRGHCHDVFHLGGHSISKEAIVLVPDGTTEHEKYVGESKGTVLFYHDAQKAVEEVLRSKGAALITLDESSEDEEPDQKIRVDGRIATFEEIASCVGLDNCMSSIISTIQSEFRMKIEPIRCFLFMDAAQEYVLNVFPKEDYDELLETMRERYCLTLKEINLESWFKNIYGLLEIVEGEHTTEQDLHHISSYRTYISAFLINLYGKAKDNVMLRVRCNITTIDGFRKYCHEVNARVEELAHRVERS